MKKHQPARPRKGNVRGMYAFGYRVVWPVVHALSRPVWQGVENLPAEGPFILAPNHMSNFDPVSMGFFMADNGFEVRFLAKDSLFRVPVIGPFMRWWGMIPVLRQSASATDALVHAREALEKGDVVGIYFEGTLTRDPAFWPMKGKTGLARLAMDLRVPIIPVVQWGAQDVMDRYSGPSIFQKRPRLCIRVLPELDFSDIPGDSENHEGVRELTQRLQDTLGAESGSLRGEVPPEVPWDMKAHDGPGKDQLTRLSKWRKQLRKKVRRQDILPATPGSEPTE